MSGIEIAGFIFSIISLIHNAYEYSERSDTLLKRIAVLGGEGFATETRNLRSMFNTQKAIFRARAIALLPIIEPGRNKTIRQLKYYDYQMDQGRNIKEDEKIDILHELLICCKQTVEEMNVHLTCITSSLSPFQENTSNSHQIMGRIRLLWEQSQIKHQVNRFKELNEIFSTLANEIIQLTKDDQDHQAYRQEPIKAPDNGNQQSILCAYRNIQHASVGLYKTISEKWCCTVHEDHVVHLSSVRESEQHATCSPVNFMTMFTGFDGDHIHLHHLKMEVQHGQYKAVTDSISSNSVGSRNSTIKTDMQSRSTFKLEPSPRNPSLEDLYFSVRRSSQGTSTENKNHGKSKRTKRQKFHLMHDNVQLESFMLGGSVAEEHGPPHARDNATDLRPVRDHCSHLRNQDTYCLETAFLGNQCIVRFYLQPEEQKVDGQFLSLNDLIRKASEDSPIPILSIPRIMGFASAIADAVLQFYSSPWLPERWESKDIYFLENKELNSSNDLVHDCSLYVSLRFRRNSKGKEVMGDNGIPLGEHTPDAGMAEIFDPGTRNERLFCLGVVLLELGYTKPWVQRLWPEDWRNIWGWAMSALFANA
ncbi:hypothetical protein F4806DRAFT_493047 [Annulohypoxylon nitens]|nr:hypothetical protein F4806DRAFT_493047 [Annulohypoxylon nitens]